MVALGLPDGREARVAGQARQIGRSYGTTRTLLREAGVRMRKPGYWQKAGAQ